MELEINKAPMVSLLEDRLPLDFASSETGIHI
jgi:hypothetical protein